MKKTLKKIVAVLVLACCCAAMLAACGEEEVKVTSDGLWQYTLATDGTVTLDKYLGQAAEVVVPDKITIDGTDHAVAKLGDAAFMKIDDGSSRWRDRETYTSNKVLTKVTVSEGIKSIGNMTFYLCSALTRVDLPESLTSIGDFAFFGCSALTEITFPKAVKNIGAYSFRACSALTTVNVLAEGTLPDLGDKAFYLVDENASGDDQYYISPSLKFFVPEQSLSLYNVDAIEEERRETKLNNHRYWSEYINAKCFPQLNAAQ
ncbi:MAG: leucine-rich repeat domain-containing protein [Clostridia bacterium]|nr:leucine-rich repeat domain-containing protein [Clostridia bacterium]